ncbi:MAG: DUF5683 domain-containing protein [Bacteroidetes bacterium]|nr:DUF5683 domain-containing protein [Bacteroidota bacterium]
MTALVLTAGLLVGWTDSVSIAPMSPSQVALRSALLPGWGQLLNGKPLKALGVWAVLGGLGAELAFLDRHYRQYRRAHRCRVLGQTDCSLPAAWAELSTETLRQRRDAYRNARDLFWILLLAVYGLNVLDAYVDAHLRDFDVSPQLAGSPPASLAPGLRLRLRFR